MSSDLEEMFGPVIYAYTRAQAIEDGVLVDVTVTAAEAGFKVPVALTQGLWTEAVAWSQGGTQDESGRLWDVLWMAFCTIKARGPQALSERRMNVDVLRVPDEPGATRASLLRFVIVCGPGDEGEPVITAFLPGED